MAVTKIKDITLDALIGMFDPAVHEKLRAMAGREGVSHLVVFENLQMDSSNPGARTAIAVGPGCTYHHVYQVKDQHLGDLPSRFQYPLAAAETKPG
jgi:hypothetical protein